MSFKTQNNRLTFPFDGHCNTCICNDTGAASREWHVHLTKLRLSKNRKSKRTWRCRMRKNVTDGANQEASDFIAANGQISDTSTGALISCHISALFLGFACLYMYGLYNI